MERRSGALQRPETPVQWSIFSASLVKTHVAVILINRCKSQVLHIHFVRAIVEQIIGTQARRFMGSVDSTYTGGINRMRGYMGLNTPQSPSVTFGVADASTPPAHFLHWAEEPPAPKFEPWYKQPHLLACTEYATAWLEL